jgi:urease accessory protein
MTLLARVAATALVVLPGAALAHTGHGEASGFTQGLMHPLGGPDHALAMVAIGLYAAMLGGRALWLVPAAFIAAMAAGAAFGAVGYPLPYAEVGIALSVALLGFAVAQRISLPAVAAMALAGLFATFHGHAHGAEMPAGVSGMTYAMGFLLASALLHGVGIALGLIAPRAAPRLAQGAGAAIALAGIALLVTAA